MNKRKLGKTGLIISEIGFGGIPIQRIDFNETFSILNTAIDSGINFFDTSRVYSDSEEKIGNSISKRRKEYYIATKSYNRSLEGMKNDIYKSLKTLKTDIIDIYQIHNINTIDLLNKVLRPDGALTALIKAKDKGDIKFIGISSHKPYILQEALKKYNFDTIQVPFNIIEHESLELINKCKKLNIGTIIMKPLAGGFLNPAAASLKYILKYPVDVVIPGMQSTEEIRINTGLGKLSKKEEAALKSSAKKIGTSFCRKCEYCIPVCPQNINITVIQLLEMYYTNYNIKKWPPERYSNIEPKANTCIECGKCEDICPYSLKIRANLKKAHKHLYTSHP